MFLLLAVSSTTSRNEVVRSQEILESVMELSKAKRSELLEELVEVAKAIGGLPQRRIAQ